MFALLRRRTWWRWNITSPIVAKDCHSNGDVPLVLAVPVVCHDLHDVVRSVRQAKTCFHSLFLEGAPSNFPLFFSRTLVATFWKGLLQEQVFLSFTVLRHEGGATGNLTGRKHAPTPFFGHVKPLFWSLAHANGFGGVLMRQVINDLTDLFSSSFNACAMHDSKPEWPA